MNQKRRETLKAGAGLLALLAAAGIISPGEAHAADWNKAATPILMQGFVERELEMFRCDGKTLTPAGAIKVNGGPAGIATTPG